MSSRRESGVARTAERSGGRGIAKPPKHYSRFARAMGYDLHMCEALTRSVISLIEDIRGEDGRPCETSGTAQYVLFVLEEKLADLSKELEESIYRDPGNAGKEADHA